MKSLYVAASTNGMDLLRVSAVSRSEGQVQVVRDVSFTMSAGRKIGIAGSTGSGKTTLVKLVAGLLQPDSGAIIFNGRRVEGPHEKLLPGHPSIAYLSQHFELRNHYTVRDFLGLRNPAAGVDIDQLVQTCRIDHLLHRRTHQLSGGERQRVALAFQLLTSPELFILDEPYSNLDNIHRDVLRSVLDELRRNTQMSFILISHDSGDLLPWADEIMVMQEGAIVQRGAPHEIFYQPCSPHVAALFGPFIVVSDIFKAAFDAHSDVTLHPGMILRPAQLKLSATGAALVVTGCNFSGDHYETRLSGMGEAFTWNSVRAYSIGETLFFRLTKND